jgi:4-hydroxyphenylacetate decarboxylase large subunit
MDIWRKNNMPIFNSVLKPDCLESGHLLHEMGVRYNATFVIETTGTSTLVNSMIALEQIVYNDKKATLDDFKAAILDNFGYKTAEEAGSYSLNAQVKREGDSGKWDKLHHMIMHAPKYGNAVEFADRQMKRWEDYFCSTASEHESLFGRPLMPNQIAVSTQAPQGAATLATPDGRLAGTTFQDGSMSAFAGTDKKGPYALFASATCWDQTQSLDTQMNMKLHPTAIKGPEGTQNLVNLTLGYMRQGGFHIQYNVVDSRMLKDAQEHPEQYQGLMVRVAGFTQYWAELGKPVQDEIISRTEYNKL